ncbi:MAG: MBL fold metallo-hydrolase [Clostridia bacterium]|nr:MBL fold metallo-hydrolase [Clostridia bacterium]
MKKLTAFLLTLCMLLAAFAACDSGEAQTEQKTTQESDVTTEVEVEEFTEADEGNTTETESESETEPPVEAALPEEDPSLSYTSADGYVMDQYDGKSKTDYRAAVKYYLENGYGEYSVSEIGGMLSTTLIGEKGYRTVTFNGAKGELYLGTSADGAILPEAGELGEKVCDVTVTQRHSPEINGMTYIVRLTDGSFLVIDGGYKAEAQTLYDTLCQLNGSDEGIHIRAWLITHSHGDHYQAFNQFSKDYASKVTLDYLLYSPVSGAKNQDSYLNGQVKTDLANFNGAQLCGIHTGTVLDFGGVRWEFLLTAEHLYKTNAPDDFNETSTVSRIKNEEGSMLFLADCGVYASDWMVESYGDALKSDMVQIAHHGCETATAELYDRIAAATCFWPCSESLFITYRGELVKQHIIEAEYSKEHLLHGYGTITRPLSYKAAAPAYFSIFPKAAGAVNTSPYASNVRIEDGVLKFDTKASGESYDPYISYTLKNVETEDYNAIRIVVNTEACSGGAGVFFTCGKDQAGKFSAAKSSYLGVAGASDDGTTTLIGYLADVEGYTGRLSSIRLDFGTEDGQTVEIYSIELFYVDVN